MGVGQARAKLLLFGEHAAVYGHPAVGCSLPWGLAVEHSPGSRWELPGLGIHEASVRALLGRLAHLAAEEALPPPTPGRLDIKTDIPLGSGFGSSGALCAGLVSLFWGDLPLEHRDRLAWKAEGLFHGTPSGIDTALALRQGWWHLDASTRPVTAHALPDPGLVLVAGAVVRESDTKSLVATLARRRESEPQVRRLLEALGSISAEAVVALARKSEETIPLLVTRAREGLRSLGLESRPLESVLDAGLGCPGALAGKLSGAGGGGAFFLVFGDRASASAALPRVEAAVAPSLWAALPRLV